MKRNGFILCALLVFARPPGAPAQDVGLELNSVPAPIALETLDGKPVNLAAYMGRKPVIIEFWATWCPVCKALEPEMNGVYKKYGKQVEFLTVAVGVSQTPRSVKRHLTDHTLPGQILWDGDGKAVRAFMAPGTSYIVVLDAKGRVAYTGFGADQKLDAVLAKVVPPARK